MSVKVLIISLLIMAAGVTGVSLFITGDRPAAASYTSRDKDRPRLEAPIEYFDAGQIKVSDVVTKDFLIKNTGNKPVQLLNINSSCGCTTGKIIYKDYTSKEFGMHAQSGYLTEISPGDTATLKLTYRPATMPIYGVVEREVYLSTNDPNNKKLVFAIKAVVK